MSAFGLVRYFFVRVPSHFGINVDLLLSILVDEKAINLLAKALRFRHDAAKLRGLLEKLVQGGKKNKARFETDQ